MFLVNKLVDFINLGDQGLETAKEFLESAIVGISPDDVYIKSPIKTPNKILAVGLALKKPALYNSIGTVLFSLDTFLNVPETTTS